MLFASFDGVVFRAQKTQCTKFGLFGHRAFSVAGLTARNSLPDYPVIRRTAKTLLLGERHTCLRFIRARSPLDALRSLMRTIIYLLTYLVQVINRLVILLQRTLSENANYISQMKLTHVCLLCVMFSVCVCVCVRVCVCVCFVCFYN